MNSVAQYIGERHYRVATDVQRIIELGESLAAGTDRVLSVLLGEELAGQRSEG